MLETSFLNQVVLERNQEGLLEAAEGPVGGERPPQYRLSKMAKISESA
jgi:hypothetical protein